MGIKVTFITIGKVREQYLQLGIAEFKKRLCRFCKLEIVEVKEEMIPDRASPQELALIRQKEGALALSRLAEGAYVVAMDIDGQHLSSEQLARKVQDVVTYGKSHLIFLIGGSIGLADEVKERADLRLSFSKMTFPHQLFRLMLFEQVYRVFKINANETYHK